MKRMIFLIALIGLLVGNVYGSMLTTKNKIIYTCRLAPRNNGYIETIRIKTTVTWAPYDEKLRIGFITEKEQETLANNNFENVKYSVTDGEPLMELYQGCPYLQEKGKRMYYNRSGNGYKISARIKKRPAKSDDYFYYDIDMRITKHSLQVLSFSDINYIVLIQTYKTNEGGTKTKLSGNDPIGVVSAKYIIDENKEKEYRKIYYSSKAFTHQGDN